VNAVAPVRAHAVRPYSPTEVRRGAQRAPVFAVAMLFIATSASACPVCFGGSSSIGKGMDSAIFFLLTIVGLVQVGFVALFWSFRRRAKELQRRREQFHLINGGVR
jgi:hypothetical protein